MNLNPLDLLFGQVSNVIKEHASPDTPGPSFDANPILGALAGLFGQHAQQSNQQFGGGVQSSNADPYGDPENQGGAANVQSSNNDPYGDPEDEK